MPPKSACTFCPAMRSIEILRLKEEDPDAYLLALEMERVFRDGKHFRGDGVYTVKGRHKATKEKLGEEGQGMDVVAVDKADARAQVRAILKDTVQPYQWELDPSPAVRGLGRNFTWQDIGQEE